MLTYERRMKVEHDVYEEDDVHDAVHHQQGDVGDRLVPEGGVERDHDGRVESEDENDPIPYRLEGRVVEDDVGGGLGRLLPVLGEYLVVEIEHLQIEK